MTQPRQFRILPRLGLKGWAIVILALSALAAILIALTVLALGVFLFMLPVLAIVTLLYYLFPSLFRAAQARRAKDVTIIDGEFRVIDAAEIERPRPEERN